MSGATVYTADEKREGAAEINAGEEGMLRALSGGE